MIARDGRQRRPVDAGGLHTLLGVGAKRTETLLVTGSRLLPQVFEGGSALGVEALNGEDSDIAVLGIYPRQRRAGEAQKPNARQEAH